MNEKSVLTRDEAESRIRNLLIEIAKVVREYEAPSGYFSANFYLDNEKDAVKSLHFNNAYWGGGKDQNRPMEYYDYDISLEKVDDHTE